MAWVKWSIALIEVPPIQRLGAAAQLVVGLVVPQRNQIDQKACSAIWLTIGSGCLSWAASVLDAALRPHQGQGQRGNFSGVGTLDRRAMIDSPPPAALEQHQQRGGILRFPASAEPMR